MDKHKERNDFSVIGYKKYPMHFALREGIKKHRLIGADAIMLYVTLNSILLKFKLT